MSFVSIQWDKFLKEARGFGEGEPPGGKWSEKKTYIVEEEPEQLPLPGVGEPEVCDPEDDVENLSSQLAQMVADSEVANEELDDLMSQIYDKIADLKGLGVDTEEDPEDYRRTRMGFMNEIRQLVFEVYSEKQRKWACAQEGAEFEEMCTGPMKKEDLEPSDLDSFEYELAEG